MTKSQMLGQVQAAYVVFLALLASGLVVTAVGQKKPENFVADEVLVKFKPGESRSIKDQLTGRLHSKIAEELGGWGWVRVKLAPGQTVESAMTSFGKMVDIASVQPNYYYRLQSVPNDTRWGD